MTNEKKIVLDKIETLINKRMFDLLEGLPSIHEIDDGIVIRFFTDWNDCDCKYEFNKEVKCKKIVNQDAPDEITMFFYLPKGSFFDFKKKKYISTLTCLSGKLKIDFGNVIRIVDGNTKILLQSNVFQGIALENSYVITTNKG